MKYKITTKIVKNEIRYIELEGKLFDLSDLLDLLEELNGTSYAGDRLVIYNRDLEKILERLKVIEMTVKGSCYAGENYKTFYEDIIKLD